MENKSIIIIGAIFGLLSGFYMGLLGVGLVLAITGLCFFIDTYSKKSQKEKN